MKRKINTKNLYLAQVGKFGFDWVKGWGEPYPIPKFVLVKKNVFDHYIDVFSKTRYFSVKQCICRALTDGIIEEHALCFIEPIVLHGKWVTYSDAREFLEGITEAVVYCKRMNNKTDK